MILSLIIASCASKKKSGDDLKVSIETEGTQITDNKVFVPIKVECLPGKTQAILQIGRSFKPFECEEETGGFSYTYKMPKKRLVNSRKEKRDFILRIRAYHPKEKDETLSQSLVVVSYKDYQTKLVINQSYLRMKDVKGRFTDVSVFGQCRQGSRVEAELFDDKRGLSLEEESLDCGEAGFIYSTRRPGVLRKGTRLLIREFMEQRPLASYEVVLFN